MKKIFLALILLLAVLPAKGQLRLIQDGRLTGEICLASNGTSAYERQAAEILQRFIGEATGSRTRIRMEK